jgi:hypothetical protein
MRHRKRFISHLLEEIRRESEPMLITEDFNMKELENERIKLMYDLMH